MRDLMKAMATKGAVIQDKWPDKANFIKKSSGLLSEDPKENARFMINEYQRVPFINYREKIKRILSIEKLPVIFGVMLYQDVVSQANSEGYLKLPVSDTKIGGHAVYAVGWFSRKGKDWLIVPNSWSEKIGMKGQWFIDFNYIEEGFIRDVWSVPATNY